MLRVLGVVRLSRERDESTSAERQRLSIKHWADSQGHHIVGWAEDLGVSAGVNPWARPELGAWLRGERAGFDVIATWRLDRLARRVLHFASLLEWVQQHDKAIVSATEGIDLSTPLGRTFAHLIAMLAEGELDAIRERTKDSYDHLVAVGRFRGGVTPYGYRSQPVPGGGYRLEIDPEPAAVLRGITEKIIGGDSINSVVTWLNTTGIPTSMDLQRRRAGQPPKGYRWRVSTLSRLLRSHTLLGYLETESGEPATGDDGLPVRRAEPLLTPRQWQQLRDSVTANTTRPTTYRHRANGSMLLRVAYCALCNLPLYRYNGRNQKYYRCASKSIGGRYCTNSVVNCMTLEGRVAEEILNRVGDRVVVRQVAADGDTTHEIRQLEMALGRLAARLEKIPDGGAAEAAVLTRMGRHEHRLAELQQRPQGGIRLEPTAVTFRAVWAGLDSAGQGRLLRDCGVRVTWDRGVTCVDLVEEILLRTALIGTPVALAPQHRVV